MKSDNYAVGVSEPRLTAKAWRASGAGEDTDTGAGRGQGGHRDDRGCIPPPGPHKGKKPGGEVDREATVALWASLSEGWCQSGAL